MADHPVPPQEAPGEDWSYLNPHADGAVAHPSPDHLPAIVLFLVPILFVIALAIAWFALSAVSRQPSVP